jgi:hypothetical protein
MATIYRNELGVDIANDLGYQWFSRSILKSLPLCLFDLRLFSRQFLRSLPVLLVVSINQALGTQWILLSLVLGDALAYWNTKLGLERNK